MLQALQGFSQGPRLDSIVNGMTGTLFVQLIAEAAGMVIMADRFMQTAVQPLKGSTSNIGQMVSQIQAAAAMANVVVNGAKTELRQHHWRAQGLFAWPTTAACRQRRSARLRWCHRAPSRFPGRVQ